MTFGDPVYTVSARAVGLVAEIAAALERYKIMMEGPDGLRLRKLNRVQTIRGTTAIEGNTLTEAQVAGEPCVDIGCCQSLPVGLMLLVK